MATWQSIDEVRALKEFKRLGYRHTEPVAYGGRRSILGRLQSECLVTVAIPDALTLDRWYAVTLDAENKATVPLSRRRGLIRTLATQLRGLHDAGFFSQRSAL